MLCYEHHLIPDSTIVALLEVNIDDLFGRFGTFVTGCQQNNRQFEIYVKDDETNNDNAMIFCRVFVCFYPLIFSHSFFRFFCICC